VLRESLEAMVEERAIGIVSKYGIGQRGVKVGAMNLMIGSAKSFDIRKIFIPLACSLHVRKGSLVGAKSAA
jgi:hypothetical protein